MTKKKSVSKSARPKDSKKAAAEKREKERALNKAQAAKAKALKLFDDIAEIKGIGLTRHQGKYAVRVNLEKELSGEVKLPPTIGGVAVVTKVVGKVKKQTAAP